MLFRLQMLSKDEQTDFKKHSSMKIVEKFLKACNQTASKHFFGLVCFIEIIKLIVIVFGSFFDNILQGHAVIFVQKEIKRKILLY